MGFIKYFVKEHIETFKELAAAFIFTLAILSAMGIFMGLMVVAILFSRACFMQIELLCVTWCVSAVLKVLVRDFRNYKKTKARLKNEKFWRVR